MMSETRPTFGVATPIAASSRHSAGRVALRDVRQHQILLVADADFAERITVGEIGDGVHLLRGGVAGRAALGLQRERDDGVARHLVLGDGIADPGVESRDRRGAPAASAGGLSSSRA